MGGGGKEQSQQVDIPDELKPLFSMLSSALIPQVPQSAGIIQALLQGQGVPQLSPVQQLFGDLLGQRISRNPILGNLPASAPLAQGAPALTPRPEAPPQSPLTLDPNLIAEVMGSAEPAKTPGNSLEGFLNQGSRPPAKRPEEEVFGT